MSAANDDDECMWRVSIDLADEQSRPAPEHDRFWSWDVKQNVDSIPDMHELDWLVQDVDITDVKHQDGSRSIYTPLRQDSIRLLRILPGAKDCALRCEVADFALDEDLVYEAISYTWGASHDDPNISVVLNGHKQIVRKNLWRFLLQARELMMLGKAPFELIWIDALCINQSDNDERQQQVSLMPVIFSRASRVIAWLGPAYDHSDDVLTRSSRSSRSKRLGKFSARTWNYTSAEGLLKLYHRRYWTRLWVLQELMRARKIMFMCGGSLVEDSIFNDMLVDMKSNFPVEVNVAADLVPPSDLLRRTPAVTLLALIAQRRPDATVLELMRMTKDLRCADPRDKVYGLLGIIHGSHLDIAADYNATLVDVAHLVLQSHHTVRQPWTKREVYQQCCELAQMLGETSSAILSPRREWLLELHVSEENIHRLITNKQRTEAVSLWWCWSHHHFAAANLFMWSGRAIEDCFLETITLSDLGMLRGALREVSRFCRKDASLKQLFVRPYVPLDPPPADGLQLKRDLLQTDLCLNMRVPLFETACVSPASQLYNPFISAVVSHGISRDDFDWDSCIAAKLGPLNFNQPIRRINTGGIIDHGEVSTLPLVEAALRGRIDLGRVLLAGGASLDMPDAHGTTPLMAAVEAHQAQSVELLLSHGADVDLRARPRNLTNEMEFQRHWMPLDVAGHTRDEQIFTAIFGQVNMGSSYATCTQELTKVLVYAASFGKQFLDSRLLEFINSDNKHAVLECARKCLSEVEAVASIFASNFGYHDLQDAKLSHNFTSRLVHVCNADCTHDAADDDDQGMFMFDSGNHDSIHVALKGVRRLLILLDYAPLSRHGTAGFSNELLRIIDSPLGGAAAGRAQESIREKTTASALQRGLWRSSVLRGLPREQGALTVKASMSYWDKLKLWLR